MYKGSSETGGGESSKSKPQWGGQRNRRRIILSAGGLYMGTSKVGEKSLDPHTPSHDQAMGRHPRGGEATPNTHWDPYWVHIRPILDGHHIGSILDPSWTYTEPTLDLYGTCLGPPQQKRRIIFGPTPWTMRANSGVELSLARTPIP